MKKKISFVLILTLLSIIPFILTGCKSSCEHNWVNTTTIVPATCTNEGLQEQECTNCGELKEIPISTINHDFTVLKKNNVEHWYECSRNECNEISNKQLHNDENKDHICDLCSEKISECTDNDKNHICDICSEKISECSDNDNDHICDLCNQKLEHIFSEWKTTSKIHYRECLIEDCNEQKDVGEHDFVDGICKTCEDKDTYGSEGLIFAYDSKTSSYKIKGYTGTDLEVVIPYYHDNGVNGIAKVKTIGEYAFVNDKIMGITYTNNNKITNVSIPNSIVTIGEYAFCGCDFTSILIPKSIEKISSRAFQSCYKLSKVTIMNPNISYGSYVFMGIGKKRPNNTDLEIILPEGMKTIPIAFFYEADIVEINLPSTIETIDEYAFGKCANLKTINFNQNLKSIGNFAFAYCTSLEEVEIPKNVKSLGNYILAYCSNLKSVTFNSTLDELKSKAVNIDKNHWFAVISNDDLIIYYEGGSFAPYHSMIEEDCNNDGNIEYWEDILTNKKYNDQYWNYEVTDIVIPAKCKGGVATCEAKAICKNCGNEYGDVLGHSFSNKWEYDENNHWRKCDNGCNEVSQLGNHDFVNGFCSTCKCRNIYGTEGLEYYSMFGIEDCTIIGYSGTDKNIVIPDYYKDSDGRYYKVGRIDSFVFKNNEIIESVTIGINVTVIYSEAFMNCKNLKEIIFKSKSIELWSNVFKDCTAITKVDFISIEALCNYEFSTMACNPLYFSPDLYINGELVTNLVIPEGVTELKEFTFYNSKIEGISLPKTLQKINKNVFIGCKKLKRVDVSSLEQWLGFTFGSYDNNPLYNAKHLYINNELLTDLVIPSNIKIINNYSFVNCKDLKTILIHDEVKSYGENIFLGCTSVEEITLPFSGFVSENGYVTPFAFYFGYREYENSLEVKYSSRKYYIPLSLKTVNVTSNEITKDAFYNCSSILTITFPNATKISSNAFYGCNNLYSIILPSTLEEIQSGAFDGCIKLVEIFNYSSLDLTAGSSEFGNVANAALSIVSDNSLSKITIDANGFVLYLDGIDVILVGYIGQESNVIIPSNVTKINKYAFYENKNITSVYIHRYVTYIDSLAFYKCDNLDDNIIYE